MGFLSNLFKRKQEDCYYEYECPYEGHVGIFFKVNYQEGITAVQIKTLSEQTKPTEEYIFITIDAIDCTLIGFVHTKWYEEECNYSYNYLKLLMEDFIYDMSDQTNFTWEYENDTDRTYWQIIGFS